MVMKKEEMNTVGTVLTYDSRDIPANAYKGIYLDFRGLMYQKFLWRYIAGLFLVRIGGISCKNLASYNVEFPWGIY